MRYKLGTLRSVRIQAYILFGVALGAILFYAVAGPGLSSAFHAAMTVSFVFWISGSVAAENRLLRHLESLEQEHEEPDATMEMLCEAAALQPIASCVPLTIFMFEWLW